MRNYSIFDRAVIGLSRGLEAVNGKPEATARENPAERLPDSELDEAQRKHVAGLMRVNHSGEIAAQALYHGQVVTARDEAVKQRLEQSAAEEGDHLIWCQTRVEELGEKTSLLSPLWYWGSFAIGALAGLAGDKWSLGFIKETEDQVVEHLQGHLEQLPVEDQKSRAVIEQMMIDEAHHGNKAVEAGGVPLPLPVKLWMRAASKVMTTLSYRL
ncbi:MAG TPA: 2-polyprenyl-3-methyl-6-methoxy-1,4-benzoquinone monooxygenase [Chromatiales bacterium]|nr:2-polyprenyl-3-methyl-6-methoxy-1,4-benzoquinone monooxygenase [Thiotrichales bacterium]HIP67846.1 2-polyprenyl-3-methyl-6-methoxy-1,4-benzoquinone monooxygenase [Chromatiales bacterium]